MKSLNAPPNGFLKLVSARISPSALIRGVILTIAVLFVLNLFPESSRAQRETTEDISRYGGREFTAKTYEKYEARPRAHMPFLKGPIPRKAFVTLSSTAERVRIRKYLFDAHVGLKFYQRKTCENCHPEQVRNIHSARVGITCRQCHGSEPISGINHYYSPMHPRRRYAFVCAKCHEGASASFASYVVHAPNPADLNTLNSFPILFLVFWAMIALAVGTFLVFLPHTLLWGLRELIFKKEKPPSETD